MSPVMTSNVGRLEREDEEEEADHAGASFLKFLH